ncbi:MAG TPA: RHS repeat-associated core domain-containing protein [Kiritimatiellia bacterium]|nr:RHS repeat-associated core domain-containing protein [Kiritimatiellia bacterium]
MEMFGVGGFHFSRFYSSRATLFTTNFVEFGVRQTWQHNWNFEVRDQTGTTNGHKHVKIRYPNGNELDFKAVDTNGIIRAPPAFQGDRLYKWTGTNVGHTMVTPDGWEYDFQRTVSPRYRLVRVRNGQGLSWNLTYAAEQKLARIENDFGRWIEIDRAITNDVSVISKLRASDGREVSYEYGTWEYSVLVTSSVPVVTCTTTLVEDVEVVDCSTNFVPAILTNLVVNTVLTNVIYPDESRAEYSYVGAQSLTNGRPLLAKAIDPMVRGPGAAAQYEYNYNAIFDFGNGDYLVTGTTLKENSYPGIVGGGPPSPGGSEGETRVSMPTGSGQYPQILEGDGTEITRIYTNGVLKEKRDGEGRPTYYFRDAGGIGFIVAVADAQSNVTAYTRDYAGRMLSVVDPMGRTNYTGRNQAGFVTNTIDRLGRVTTYTRDMNNWLLRIDFPDGSFEEMTRNDYGQVLTHRQRNGGTRTFTYFGTNEQGGVFGDLKTEADAMGNTNSYSWSAAGLLIGHTDAGGHASAYAYDWRGSLLARTNADQSVIAIQYDRFGNRTNYIDERGVETHFVYDDDNRLATVRDALGRVTSYEYGRSPSASSGCGGCGSHAGTISRTIAPDGKTIEYGYDRSDKRTNEVIAAGTADESVTTWTYDEVGRLKTQTDANGNLHTWVYDPAGRVIAETNAAGNVTAYSYDPEGNLTNRVDGAGVVTKWEYDAMNRVTAIESDTLRYEYAYDLGGRRTAMHTRVNGQITETTTYTYDFDNRLIEKIDPTGYALTYAYDPIGNRTNLVAARVEGGPPVLEQSYSYDPRNRLTTLTGNGKTTSFEYDAVGRRTNAVWPNATTAAYTYDDAHQLLALVHGRASPPGEPLASFTYGYDLSGNRTNMITLEGENTYAYDNRNWLTYAAYPDGSAQEFAYDPVGNRTQLSAFSATSVVETTYTYGSANRLLASASALETNEYAYDGAGRLTNQLVNPAVGGTGGQTRRFAYNYRGQMTALHDKDGRVFAYDFDGDGNRIRQSLNDCLETRFVYDGPNVVLELTASNDVATAYINGLGIDQPIERIGFIAGQPRFRHVFHADALGSIVALTDESGATVKTYAYEAFGRIRAETGDAPLNRITYTGREALGDSGGWYYYRNRVVDVNAGRFISVDPLGYVDGANLYIYIGNNAIIYSDPYGEKWSWKQCKAKIVLMVGITTGEYVPPPDKLPSDPTPITKPIAPENKLGRAKCVFRGNIKFKCVGGMWTTLFESMAAGMGYEVDWTDWSGDMPPGSGT